MKSAVSIALDVTAKRHISLCGCVYHIILVVSLFDHQYKKEYHVITPSEIYDMINEVPKGDVFQIEITQIRKFL